MNEYCYSQYDTFTLLVFAVLISSRLFGVSKIITQYPVVIIFPMSHEYSC